jgi:thiol-disulfide isomerase/thioredoxin
MACAGVSLLLLAACGSSDDAASGANTVSTESQASVDETAAPAVLEVSDALTIDGGLLDEYDETIDDPTVGTPGPVITGQQFDGSSITIGGPTDQPTMLVFLAHWCPHCNDEIPEIVKLRDAGDLPADLNIIGISTAVVDDRDNYPPSEWMVEKDWTWPVLADTAEAEAFQTYGGTGFPYTVMLDADGNVLARKSGNEPAERIKAWIDDTLATASA